MTQFFAPATAIALLMFFVLPASAESYLGHQQLPTHWYDQGSRKAAPKAKKPRAVKHAPARSSNLVTIQCGPKTIRVASTAANQLGGLCRELYARYKFNVVGGWRPGKCWVGGKHPCGGAIDISQSCRSKGPGHCLPRDFPVAESERLAAKWGLIAGSKWRHRDVGHFETAGSLAGNGKWNPGVDVAAVEPEPDRRTWPIARIEGEYRSPVRTVPNDVSKPPVHDIDAPTNKAHRLATLHDENINGDVSALRRAIYVPKPKDQQQGVIAEIRAAAKAYDLPENMLLAIIKVESNFNPLDRTGSYKGLCQLSDFLFGRYGDGSIWSARDNAWACARKIAYERALFVELLGRDPEPWELYMAHQQGWQGAWKHAENPERPAWQNMHSTDEGKIKGPVWAKRAIWGNLTAQLKKAFGSVGNVTSGQFAARWRDKINHWQARFEHKPPTEVTAAKKTRVKVAVKKRKIRMASR